jgi:ABC-type transport system involved in cytochrome c biogenesis permease subunit
MSTTTTRRRRTLLLLGVLLALGAGGAAAQPGHVHGPGEDRAIRRAQPWDAKLVEIAAGLPIQEGGRIKPLQTYAGFLLLGFNGRRSTRDLDGARLSPTEWLLDCLFYPEAARGYRVFLVQTTEVLDAVGLAHAGKKKRDRYSYLELLPGRDSFFELADRYMQIDSKQRTHVQEQIVDLANNLSQFELLVHFFDFARLQLPVDATPALAEIFAGRTTIPVSDLLDRAPLLVERFSQASAAAGGSESADTQAIAVLVNRARTAMSGARGLALLPPDGTRQEQPEWLSPADAFAVSFAGGAAEPRQLFRILEELPARRDDAGVFAARLAAFRSGVEAQAARRGEASKVPLEVSFYKAKFFDRGLVLYLLGFVLVALGWLRRPGRVHGAAIWTMLVGGTALLAAGIVVRCIIRSRPPVSTLYETILFITATAVLAAIVVELVDRRRIALAMAAVLGPFGLFLANRYEAMEGVDTMPSLVAVLDTNFWLSTHVTTITMGYSAGLLAAGFAHVYVLGRLFGLGRGNRDFYRRVVGMTYGIVCFGLILSVTGTILGGVWANESWGRFWGWDPKENGALMIVLWQLFILHARLGGYIRDLGIALAAIFGGMIVAFSWWGVNLLGIGLHSYGFTSGVMRSLLIFYGIEILVLACGAVLWMRGRQQAAARVHEPAPTAA